MDDNSQYLELFFEETDEHLLKLNELVLEFEKDATDTQILNDIFRSAHTLKGMAGTMGFEKMTEVTHKLENVFSILKEEKLIADEEIINVVFNSLDALAEIVENIRNEVEEGDYSQILTVCDRIVARADSKAEAIQIKVSQPDFFALDESDWSIIAAAQASNYNTFQITVTIEEDSMMVNARAFLVINKLEEVGEVMKTDPVSEILEAGDFGRTFQLLYITERDQQTVSDIINEQSEVEAVEVMTIGERRQDELAVIESTAEVNKKEKTTMINGHNHNQSVRVDLEKLDSFMSLVSELIIYRTQLEDISEKNNNKKMQETLSYVSRVTNQLQNLVLNIRMQPLQTVTNRFPRVVRDLSNDSGKPMELVIEGDDTELDRTIVSELNEPLIHLIRNSADHGIESPEIRRALGKPEKGTIKISAYQEGNRVFITVSDDGKGLDAEAIKQSAEKKGIATAGLSPKEIQELIFHPGFSTAEKVTKISGRGVGMDVVKTKIQELGGMIDIKSEPSVGTSFRLSLPLTLSIIPALLVQVEAHTFAIPLSVINKVIHTNPDDIKAIHGGEVLLENDKTIPVIRLENHLNISRDHRQDEHLVLVTIDGNEYGLSVNAIIGQQEIVIKELGEEFEEQTDYLGATIMGDGSIVLILNVTAICMERKTIAHV